MAYLIAQVWGPLLVAALCGGVAGWFWHAGRLRPRQIALEAERRRLRTELLDLAVGRQTALASGPAGDDENTRRRIAALERELAEARGRGAEADVLRRRLADVESNSGQPRPVQAVDVTDYTTRIAALEVEIDAARRKVSEAEALQARVADLAAQTPPAPADDGEADLARWRTRYFEARTNYLEDVGRANAESLAQAQAQVAALEAKAAIPPPDDTEKSQLIWRNRYLAERLKYVESSVAASEPADPEAENRRRWRMRYLEKRIAHLEAAPAEPVAVPPPVEVAPLHARIAELEQKSAAGEATATKLIEAEDETIRARWTARYLQARVSYLESSLSAMQATPKAAPVSAPEPAPVVEVAPPPPAPAPEVFRMERPATLSAPRSGAPDDLTRIEGVTQQNQNALRALGVHHYDQIAGWSPAHAAWVNQYLNLGGRIARERWIEQAKKLAT